VTDRRCDECGKQPATVRYTEIDEGNVTRRSYCRACAEGRGLLDEAPKPIVALPEGLPWGTEADAKAVATAPELVCSTCGLAFGTFQQTGRLGCPSCYVAFRARLVPLLRKLHGPARHAGKAPRSSARKAELRQQVEDLRRELERAVRAEDYERAARLRDELRAVEQEQSVTARRTGGDVPGSAP